MKKSILFIIPVIILFSSCIETEYVDIKDQNIIMYSKNIITGTNIVQNNQIRMLCYDSTNIEFVQIDSIGNYTVLANVNNFLTDSVNYDSIRSIMLYKTINNENIILYKLLNQNQNSEIIILNENHQLKKRFSIITENLNLFSNDYLVINSNGNLGLVNEKQNPGNFMNFEINENDYDINTGEFIDSVSFLFENKTLIGIYNDEKSGYLCFISNSNSPPGQPQYYENIQISKIDNGIITNYQTSISLSHISTVNTIDDNQYIITYFDNETNLMILNYSLSEGIIWQKTLFNYSTDGYKYPYCLNYAENFISLTGLAVLDDLSCVFFSNISTNGDLIWTNYYKAPYSEGISIINKPDGAVTVLGSSYSAYNTNTFFSIKTDKNGSFDNDTFFIKIDNE